MACLAGAVSPALILDKLAITMIQVDQFIDSARLISDVKKLISLKYVDDILAGRYLSAASDVSFLISDFGSSMSFLGYLRLIDIEKIGAAVGSIGIYGHYVPSIAVDVFVGTLSLHVQTIAFMFLGLQTACDIASEGITKERILWLVTCIFEVVHKTFLFLAWLGIVNTYWCCYSGCLGHDCQRFWYLVGLRRCHDRVKASQERISAVEGLGKNTNLPPFAWGLVASRLLVKHR